MVSRVYSFPWVCDTDVNPIDLGKRILTVYRQGEKLCIICIYSKFFYPKQRDSSLCDMTDYWHYKNIRNIILIKLTCILSLVQLCYPLGTPTSLLTPRRPWLRMR